ncbi:RNA polymerase sigma factor [Paludisphaera mucosa]|uniref:RNA polymerase sigma factor n=1 Tax=Paludisphaera mucosa TaxID=3030827 RepID=A0ABT6F966_9BACT|nr:RNA polymerase sigma factor [Paludisphaera mucosa]MDG3004133.1 RNA polymerase sigma factor [Paludisphaera mucosa]
MERHPSYSPMTTPDDDARLLADFLRKSDPEAFAALVARLGPSVLRICRTVLYDAHLAEDAFQATFLVFYKKAASIQDPGSLRGWLCGTAYKTAARIRRRSIRVAQRECSSDLFDPSSDDAPESDHELFLILRQELDGLPDKYRAPLILCYLEGLTHEQTAEQLGWATGTVKVRLVRGRKLLRERLDRRKVALGAGLVLVWRREAGAAPPSLVESTLRATGSAGGRVATARIRTGPLDWTAICRAVLLLTAAVAVAATATDAIIRPSPPPGIDRDDLPANLTDVFRSVCF